MDIDIEFANMSVYDYNSTDVLFVGERGKEGVGGRLRRTTILPHTTNLPQLGVCTSHPCHVVVVVRPVDWDRHIFLRVDPRMAGRCHHHLVLLITLYELIEENKRVNVISAINKMSQRNGREEHVAV